MIIDKPSLLETPPVQADTEAPPSYDLITTSSPQPQPPRIVPFASSSRQTTHFPPNSSSSPTFPRDEKRPYPIPTPPPTSNGPVSFAGHSLAAPQGPAGPSKQKGGWLGSYFSGSFKTDQEVRNTVLNLVKDVVKSDADTGSVSILLSCAEACRARGSHVSFETLMQEPSIESHTPLYWAILKQKRQSENRSVEEENSASAGVIDVLLSFPLTPTTLVETRQACLLISSQDIFQRIYRAQRSFATGPADMLNLASLPADEIQVKSLTEAECPGAPENGAFTVHLYIHEFQRRMRILNFVRQEFIAQNRLWAIVFYAYTLDNNSYNHKYAPGAWVVALELLETSPSTYIDSRFTISPASSENPKSKPPISILMKSRPHDHLKPTPSSQGKISTRFMMRGAPPGSNIGENAISSGLPESLQFDGNSYIETNGTFHVLFEAKLAPNASGQHGECIIC